MIILGIDPGVASTGYGVIKVIKKKSGKKRESDPFRYKVLEYGVITTHPSLLPGERLKKIYNETSRIIKKYQPQALIVENLYFFKNLKTAIPVGEAKGIILLLAAKKKIPLYEVTPPQVKMAVVGYGKAEKKQVQKMIKFLFNLPKIPQPDDAADALAIAFCGTSLFYKNKFSS